MFWLKNRYDIGRYILRGKIIFKVKLVVTEGKKRETTEQKSECKKNVVESLWNRNFKKENFNH